MPVLALSLSLCLSVHLFLVVSLDIDIPLLGVGKVAYGNPSSIMPFRLIFQRSQYVLS